MIAKSRAPMAASFLLSVCVGCSTPPENPTKSFQGSWRVGNPGVDGACINTVVFAKDICQMIEPTITKAGQAHFEVRRVDKSIIQVDGATTPARIDFVYVDGEHQGQARSGIFVFEGRRSRFTWRISAPPGRRCSLPRPVAH